MKSQGFGSRTQALLGYFTCAGIAGVVLFGIQYLLVPKSRTLGINIWFGACAVIAVSFGLTYRFLARRMKRNEHRL